MISLGMTKRERAQMIPVKFLEKVLVENLIYKAVPQPGDLHARALFTIWTTYVATDMELEEDCTYCLHYVIECFKAIQPYMIEIVKEHKLIEDL